MAVFPFPCAPQKDQSGSAADWRSPKSGDREDDGRPGYPRGAGDPETADGGIRTECARRGHLSRRSLSFSRNLRAGELSEALPPAQPSRFAWCHLDATFLSATRRLVCEARKESSGCKVSDGSQNVQSFATGSPTAKPLTAPLCGATPLAEIAEFVDRSLFTSLRAVGVTAPPCSDRHTVDWRSPQTQRRYFCISPWLRTYGNSQCFQDFLDSERIDRVTPHVCGRHGRSVTATALPTLAFWTFST